MSAPGLGRPTQVVFDLASGTVTKKHTVRSAAVEAATTEAAARATRHLPGVVVPAVRSVSAASNELVLEYIDGMVDLASLVIGDVLMRISLLSRVGEALASLHRGDLVESQRHRSASPGPAMRPDAPDVLLHGDLTIENVLVRPLDNSVVFLDWSAAPRLGQDLNWGDPLWDLAWLARSLTSNAPRHLGPPQVGSMIFELFTGYVRAGGAIEMGTLADALDELSGWSRPRNRRRLVAVAALLRARR